MGRRSGHLNRVGHISVEVVDDIRSVRPTKGWAIVSSDDTWLSASGGVSEAILHRAGLQVRLQMDAEVERAGGRLPLGTTVQTGGGNTGASWILHATTIDYERRRSVGGEALAALLLRVFDHAAFLGARNLALPMIGTGTAGATSGELIEAIARALSEHATAPFLPERVVLAVVDPAARDEWSRRARALEKGATAAATLAELAQTSPKLLRVLEPLGADPQPGLALLHGLLRFLDDERQAVESLVERSGDRSVVDDLRVYEDLRSLPEVGHDDPIVSVRVCRALYRLASSVAVAPPGASSGAIGLVLSLPAVAAFSVVGAVVSGATGALSARAPKPRKSAQHPRRPLAKCMTQRTPTARLAALLLERLDRDSIDGILARAAARGFAGDREAQIAEIVLQEDPSKLLSDHFRLNDLRATAGWLGVDRELSDQKDVVARAILETLEFSLPVEPEGLHQHESKCRSLSLRAAQYPKEARRCVQDAAVALERALKQLLAFHSRLLFDKPPDSVMRRLGKLGATASVGRASLGTLLQLVRGLDDLIESGSEGEAARRYRVWYSRPISATRSERLAELRNQCAHDRDSASADYAAVARLFFAEADLWFEHLKKQVPLLPPVLVVCRTETDEWGRQTVFAKADSGLEERLHTDLALQIGHQYFMLPKSNPVRMFPVLLPL